MRHTRIDQARIILTLSCVALLACGEGTTDFSDQAGSDRSMAGSGGESGQPPAPDAEAEGGDSGSGGESGSEGAAGSPGACDRNAPLPDDVVEAAERCLDTDLFVTDPEELDGKSFVLPAGLCPQKEDPDKWEEWDELYKVDFEGGTSLRTLHLVRQGDALELVSAVPTDAEPKVQVSTLEPESSGFRVSNLTTCARTGYSFEDTYGTYRYTAPLAHLVFVRGETGELEAVVAARVTPEDVTLLVEGGADLEPPAFEALDPNDFEYALDDYWAEQPGAVAPPYHFFFDEPVTDADIVLVDEHGNDVNVEKIRSHGFVVGFAVGDLVANSPAFSLDVTDLAGNEWQSGATYSGITLAPTDGDLESSQDFLPVHPLTCDSVDEFPGAAALQTGAYVLRGERSLFLSECGAYVRVTRSPGATALAFDARAVHGANLRLDVAIQSIDAGGAPVLWEVEAAAWPLELEAPSVSLPQKLTVPLPPSGDDFLVTIGAEAGEWENDGGLWLDSFVTE